MRQKRIRQTKGGVRFGRVAVLGVALIVAQAVTTAGLTTTITSPPLEKAVAAVDRQVLEEVVDKALERQLAPIKEMLTQLTIRQPTLPDIVGGIGYILGLFGVWAYFLSKRTKGS